jgi:hypothetical protein
MQDEVYDLDRERCAAERAAADDVSEAGWGRADSAAADSSAAGSAAVGGGGGGGSGSGAADVARPGNLLGQPVGRRALIEVMYWRLRSVAGVSATAGGIVLIGWLIAGRRHRIVLGAIRFLMTVSRLYRETLLRLT